jgi:tellurite resistance protein TerC
MGFTSFVLVALALDLGVFHRVAREVRFREALGWTIFWSCLALFFAFYIAPRTIPGWSGDDTANFLSGYLVELSLSMDNVFVIALIFGYFAVPRAWQHRVLFWGILGALVMRGLLIWAGAELVARFHWVLYLMGAFLVFTGIKLLCTREDHSVEPERNSIVRLARRLFPVSKSYEGHRFVVRVAGRATLTPLAIVLVMVETTDVVFAVDSIPAIFGITTKPFLVFTSNVFAILGLRSLFFVLANAIQYFRHLKFGLSVILIFIGVKMLAEPWLKAWLGDRLTNLSLMFVVGILFVSMVSSLLMAWRDRTSGAGQGGDAPRGKDGV